MCRKTRRSFTCSISRLAATPERDLVSSGIQQAPAVRAHGEFFSDHFNIEYATVEYMKVPDERDGPQACVWQVPDMVRASAFAGHAEYPDNTCNRRNNINENYAREIMELHTLGDGGYTQTDANRRAADGVDHRVTRCLVQLRPQRLRLEPVGGHGQTIPPSRPIPPARPAMAT
jgi:hypothetical protein